MVESKHRTLPCLPTIHKAPTSAFTTGVLMRETAMPENIPFYPPILMATFLVKYTNSPGFELGERMAYTLEIQFPG